MTWQRVLAQGFSSARDLLAFLDVPSTCTAMDAEQVFKTRVPRGFALRMEKSNPDDPLLLQVLATEYEMQKVSGFIPDALNEKEMNPRPGLLHKYHGRVLLVFSSVCAVHCRYCFRRAFPYKANNPGKAGWEHTLDYIKKDTTIQEVILSGGDPLLVADGLWAHLLLRLDEIAHVKTLRIHTRVPIVLPERLETSFLKLLGESRLKKVVVLHTNHPNEINADVKNACALLQAHHCVLLNQSVLLKRVNDNATVLAQLSHALFDAGVLPYYLHVLDKVEGTSHFDMPLSDARHIYTTLQSILPGYLVPRLAREDPGMPNKTLL